MRDRILADPRNYIAQPVLALSTAPCFVDGAHRAAARRPAAVRAVRREDHDRARRADARRAAQGLAGRQLVAGRRVEGHLGASQRLIADPCFPRVRRQPVLDEPLSSSGRTICARARVIDAPQPDAQPRSRSPPISAGIAALTAMGLRIDAEHPGSAGGDSAGSPPTRQPRPRCRPASPSRATTPRRCAKRSAPRCGSS